MRGAEVEWLETNIAFNTFGDEGRTRDYALWGARGIRTAANERHNLFITSARIWKKDTMQLQVWWILKELCIPSNIVTLDTLWLDTR